MRSATSSTVSGTSTTVGTRAGTRAAPTASSRSSAGCTGSTSSPAPRTSSTSRTRRYAAFPLLAPTSSSASGRPTEVCPMIEGLAVWIGRDAVVLTSACPLTTLSSAVCGGGLVTACAIVNLHVALDDPCTDPASILGAYVRGQGVPEPYVGLLTGAWTEHATVGEEDGAGMPTFAVATVGLSNRVAAGRAPVTPWTHGTINTIVVVDANPEPAALVNAIVTVTEVKGLVLHDQRPRRHGRAGERHVERCHRDCR